MTTNDDQARRQPSRDQPGFWSSARAMSLPLGPRIQPGAVAGYYIDLRVKASTPEWPPAGVDQAWPSLHVVATQWGLACYEHYLQTGEDVWLAAARRCADELVRRQVDRDEHAGGWQHPHPFDHTFPLAPPWLSGMAQGQGASLLVRVFHETREDRYAEAARLALRPLACDAEHGGVRSMLGGRPFPEEYPTSPPSFVLNGGIFAIWGLYDVAVGLSDPRAAADFGDAAETLACNLHRWDTGYWSRYDLHPHPLINVASSFYHDLHIKQLRAMYLIAPNDVFSETSARWMRYESSRKDRYRAFVAKAAFRMLVPRNSALARRLPWSPFFRDRSTGHRRGHLRHQAPRP